MSAIASPPRPDFAQVIGDELRLVRVVETDAHEGPVYVPSQEALYFTTLPQRDRDGVPRVDIKRLGLDGELTVVRAGANAANGMTLGQDGRLLVCEQGTFRSSARITAFDPETGEVETLVDNWYDLRLNSPNDIAVAADGAIWFTDPTYGFVQGFRPRSDLGDRIYRYEPDTGRLRMVRDSLDHPNGLALSPSGQTLYVTDSGEPNCVVAFDVAPCTATLSNERVFAEIEPGYPDGIKVDAEGRVYVSSFSGVQVFDPTGEHLGEIPVPDSVNFCFGGPENDVLFITNDAAVYAAYLQAKGA